MTNPLTPQESDAVAVIKAAIDRNAAMATDLEAEALSHENLAGEAKLRATAYREANENLTKQLSILEAGPAPDAEEKAEAVEKPAAKEDKSSAQDKKGKK